MYAQEEKADATLRLAQKGFDQLLQSCDGQFQSCDGSDHQAGQSESSWLDDHKLLTAWLEDLEDPTQVHRKERELSYVLHLQEMHREAYLTLRPDVKPVREARLAFRYTIRISQRVMVSRVRHTPTYDLNEQRVAGGMLDWDRDRRAAAEQAIKIVNTIDDMIEEIARGDDLHGRDSALAPAPMPVASAPVAAPEPELAPVAAREPERLEPDFLANCAVTTSQEVT